MQLPTQFKRKLKIICVTNQKGGCGKSTISLHLGCELAELDYFVGFMDLDPHNNLTQWWNKRESGDPDMLQITIDQLEAAIPRLEEGGLDFLIIDTPGFEHADITAVLKLADVLLIPSKASFFDLWATAESLVDLAKVDTPKLFVLNEVHPSTNIATDAVVALSQVGKLGPTIHWKAGFIDCLEDGNTIKEVDRRNFGCVEIAALADFVRMNLGIHVENPVLIDPLTKKRVKKEVVKKASKHGSIRLDGPSTDSATAQVDPQPLKLVSK